MTTTEDKKTVANFGRGAIATKRGLILAESMTIAQWLDVGKRLFQVVDTSGWWIGDWLFFGQWTYGKKYATAAEATGFELQSLRNFAYVASRFDVSRRRDNLSWSHHETVAALKPADADRLLEQAEANGWTRQQLRDAVRSLRSEAPTLPAAASKIEPARAADDNRVQAEDVSRDKLELHFTVPRQRVERWSAAAAAMGKDLDTWAADVLDAAAVLNVGAAA